MAITLTSGSLVKVPGLHTIEAFGRLTVGAGNYAAGGLDLDFTALLPGILTTKQPYFAQVTGVVGFVFEYDLTNKKLIMRSAGGNTPAGTISSDSAGTPAGTVAAPVFTGTPVTPTGTVAAPVFTGDALGTHVHDVLVKGGQAAAGNNVLQAAATAILGKEEAVDATFLGADSATKGGVLAVTAGTPAGTNSAPAFTGDQIVPAGTNSAPAFTGSALAGHTHTFTGTAAAKIALVELTNAAAIPTAIVDDTQIRFRVVFPKA